MDRRFQAVVTTGIYCRPGCRAQPKRENVRPFEYAAAAEAQGFRPCLRCRPDQGPGWPDWLGPSELVCRALHLIGQGALDDAGVDDLAARLGVGSRHLRRLFDEHVGASPVSIARSRRAHFARRLLDETDLSVTQIAFASGFSSVRQFNRTMLEVFRYPPTGLRERRRRRDPLAGDHGLRVRLVYRPPLAWTTMARYLAARAIPGVESVDEHRYRRTIEWDGAVGTIELRPDAGDSHLVLAVDLPRLDGLIHVVEHARRIFDLGADPGVITRALDADPTLAPLVADRPGLRVPGAWDPYEVAVRAVLGQQVSVPAATILAGKLVTRLGQPVTTGDTALTHLFPPPEVVAEADLTTIGLPAARAETVRSVAAAVAGGELRLDGARGLDALVDELESIRGVGSWTANYIAMRACGQPDAFPAGDLGLRRAAGDGSGPITASELERRAEAWRPWRAYAAMQLWTSDRAVAGNGQTPSARRVTTAA
jgi:AraC family transcriptional regulator of adaptative response / DNA-3-methyladenine glycosylase II